MALGGIGRWAACRPALPRWHWVAGLALSALGAGILAGGCGNDESPYVPSSGGGGGLGAAGGGGATGGTSPAGGGGALPFEIDPARVLADVTYLSSPELVGRAPATAGNEAALDYVEELFVEIGLQPAGDDGTYRHAFGFDWWQVTAPMTLALAGTELEPGADFLGMTYSGSASVTAEVVFVGYGITVPSFDAATYPSCPIDPAGYDDYAGVDVTGKIALVLRHGPADDQAIYDHCPGNDACAGNPCLWNFGYKSANAALHGAAAVLIAQDFNHPADEIITGTLDESYYEPGIAALFVHRAPFESAIPDLSTWAETIDTTGQPSSAATGIEASVEVSAAVEPVETANLLGLLPGTDPEIGQELVIVGGHVDHLGEDLGTGLRYLGADDNASGVAVTMELARALAHSATEPARSVLFAAWNAEEAGLVGSCGYVSEHLAELEPAIMMFSIDMVGGGNGSGLDVYGGNRTAYSWLMDVFEGASAADELSFSVEAVDAVDASDHACFAAAGTQAVMLSTAGAHPYYHTPDDTIDHVSVANLEAATRLSWAALRTLAAGEEQTFVGRSGPPHPAPARRAESHERRQLHR